MKLYARLFTKILYSSLMQEDIETRFLFITCMLLANDDGVIDMPLSALARSANMPLEMTGRALQRLVQPDPDSGCRDEEGRRLVPLDPDRPARGWRIPSWSEYKDVLTAEHERELGKRRVARFRAKPPEGNADVTGCNARPLQETESNALSTSTSSPAPGTVPSGGISAFGAVSPPKTLLEAALAYAKRGLPVLPVDREKNPLNRHGSRGATTSLTKIRAWWNRWPDANVGIATGDALSALDIDGSEGETTLRRLVAEHGALPETSEIRTGRGRHLWFEGNPRFRNSVGKLGPGIDTRGAGGYVVAPPSIHESGIVYALTNPGVQPAVAPEWLTELTARKSEKATHRYAAAALNSASKMVRDAATGQRNDVLYDQARGIGRLVADGRINREEAAGCLLDAAVANGLSRDEARATIESGFNAKPENLGGLKG